LSPSLAENGDCGDYTGDFSGEQYDVVFLKGSFKITHTADIGSLPSHFG
jgi:hypothetical protein